MLLELAILPLECKAPVADCVARAIDVIDKSGLSYQVTATGTLIEGEWDQVMGVAKRCCEAVAGDCERLVCEMKYEWRRDKVGQIREKVERVEQILGRSVTS